MHVRTTFAGGTSTASPSVRSATTRRATAWRSRRASRCTPTPASGRPRTWATQGGRVKADWSKAPFVASYHGIDLDVCECYGGGCVAGCAAAVGGSSGRYCSLSAAQVGKMQWVQSNYRIYDYCADPKRWINGQKPVECDLAQY